MFPALNWVTGWGRRMHVSLVRGPPTRLGVLMMLHEPSWAGTVNPMSGRKTVTYVVSPMCSVSCWVLYWSYLVSPPNSLQRWGSSPHFADETTKARRAHVTSPGDTASTWWRRGLCLLVPSLAFPGHP